MSPISLILILTLNQSNDRTTLAVKQLYPLQQSCKLISSIPISTSSFRFPNSSIPWFKSKSGNHRNTAICHLVFGHDQTNSSEIYCLSHLHTHDNTLANWHPPYPSQYQAKAAPSRRFRGSNPRAEITEHRNMPYRTWSRVVQLNYAELPAPFAYSRQHICKLTSSVPISTSSYSFSKSSIPWFKYKSGNHGTQQSIIS